MKKLINFFGMMLLLLTTSMFMSCKPEVAEEHTYTETISFDDFQFHGEKTTEEDATVIHGSTMADNAWAFCTFDLSKYGNAVVDIKLSCKMKTSSSVSENLMWQVNLNNTGYPMVVEAEVASEWVEVAGNSNSYVDKDGKQQEPITLVPNSVLYLSTHETDFKNFNVYIKDIDIEITYTTTKKQQNPEDEWMVAPSLKEAYEGKLDYIGMSVQWNWPKPEFETTKVQAGLERHFNSITMGNEMKPDEFLGTYTKGEPKSFEEFTDSYGTTIKVPKDHLNYGVVDQCLNASKNIGAKMRGHVLVWHSQTADWFFKENYKSSGELVDKATMTARQEWYIKSVLEHIKDWEDKNNNGERIIYCWDVVNEAADDSGTQLRSASNWYKIYNDDEFIVNAFRFANKYAPKDVLLAYNDYNECQSNKTEMILEIIKSVQSRENDVDLPTRIDVMGMQSHNKYGTPSVSTCDSTIKKYLATGLDVHITELDIGAMNTTDAKDAQKLKKEYKDYFKMYLKYAKKGDEPGVSSVTIWGITDGSTWLNSESQQQWLNNTHQYPLLFDDNYYAKPAFYGVLEAAQESN